MALYRPKGGTGKKSPAWHYDFIVNSIRYRGSTGETNKVRAREQEVEKRKSARSGNRPQEITLITFDDLADKYVELHVSKLRRPDQYEVIVRRLRERFKNRPAASITPLDCAEVMAARLRQSKKPATRNNTLVVMKHLFTMAEEWGFLAEGSNPARRIKFERVRNTRERFPKAEDVQAIMAECDDWLRPVVQFASMTGARKGEILRLTWNDVDFGRGHIVFMDTKNGDNRHFPLMGLVAALLKSLPGGRRVGEARVFQRKGNPIQVSSVDGGFGIARRKAGLEWVRFHDLRHGWATTMASQGVPVRTLMDLGGWRDMRVVLRYMHVSPSSKVLALEALDRAFGGPQTSTTLTSASA